MINKALTSCLTGKDEVCLDSGVLNYDSRTRHLKRPSQTPNDANAKDKR